MAPTPAFTFSDQQFRSQFPAFANTTTYSELALQQYFDMAGLYVANVNYGALARAGAALPSLYLLTAHLAYLGNLTTTGQTPGIETQATVDKVSVTMLAPPVKNNWQFWLSQSPYGRQLLALLTVQSVGGFYAPGSPGRAGFTFSGAAGWPR